MSGIRQSYDAEFKKNVLKLICANPTTRKDFIVDLGINISFIFSCRRICIEKGDKTKLAEQQDSL